MGENVFRISLGELTTVRVICGCGTVTEVPLDRLGRLDSSRCAGCNQQFATNLAAGEIGRLSALQRAIQDVADPNIKYRIEFPLPLPRD